LIERHHDYRQPDLEPARDVLYRSQGPVATYGSRGPAGARSRGRISFGG